MAENINIDFMPNRKTSEIQRVSTVEDYLKLLTDRTKFCFTSIYDDFADIGKRIDDLESFSVSTPSSVDLKVENAVILQQSESQQVINNFTEIRYVDGNTVGYGDTPNTIICNGILIRNDNDNDYQNCPKYKYFTFSKGSDFYAAGVSRISAVSNIVIDVAVESVYETYKKLRSQITVTNTEDGTRRGYLLTRFIVNTGEDYAVSPSWSVINPPTEAYPYGLIRMFFDTLVCDTDGVWERQYTNTGVYLNVAFASEAEYNAAIGLTNIPLELIKIQDFQYLVPESKIIVDKELSENSDNTIANSTVAKALSSKAEKEAVEKLSLVVESKADIIEVEALAEIVNDKAEASDLTAHTDNTDNPHNVTKAQIGLGSVENKSSAEILSELEIGGRNLILKSDFSGLSNVPDIWSVENDVAIAYSTAVGVTSNSTASIELSVSDYILNCSSQTALLSIEYFVEEEITYGTTSPWVGAQIAFYSGNAVIKAYDWYGNKRFPTAVSTDWSKFGRTISTTGLENVTRVSVRFYFRDASGKVKFRHPKLEMGNKATDWTIAPEDTDEEISALEQTVNQINTEVEIHETEISEIQNMKIGGRNLLKDSAKLMSTIIGRGWTIVENGVYNYLSIDTSGGLWNECRIPFHTGYGELADEMIVSFDFYESVSDLFVFALAAYDSEGNRLGETRNIYVSNCTVSPINSEWQHATFKFIAAQIKGISEYENGHTYFLQFKTPREMSGQARIRNPKAERGNKPTDWTPAPEDAEIRITSLEERVAALEAAILSLGGET